LAAARATLSVELLTYSPNEGNSAMKRVLIALAGALSLAAFSLPAASSALANGAGVRYSEHPTCGQDAVTCTELAQPVAGYTGHDEPSLLFYSDTALRVLQRGRPQDADLPRHGRD